MRVPFVAIPQPGESLTSAVRRTLDVVGGQAPALARSMSDWRHVTNFATNSELANWRRTTDLAAETLRSMTFRRHQTALPEYSAIISGNTTVPAAARRTWLWPGCTQACPHCLHESDGAWQLRWRLPWTFYCLTHRTVLLSHCPLCSRRLYEHHRCPRHLDTGEPWYFAHQPHTERSVPLSRKHERHPTAPNHPVATAPPEQKRSFDETTRHIDDALEGEHVEALETHHVTASEYLDTLRSLTGLYVHLERLRTGDDQHQRRAVAAPPLDPHQRGRLLSRAVATLNQPHGRAVELLRADLSHVQPDEGLAVWLKDHTLDTRLIRELLAPLAAERRTIGRTTRQRVMSTRHIPQLLWPAAWTQVRPMLEASEPTGRAYCSMLLVKTQDGCTWAQAGARLGLPPTLAYNIARTGTATLLTSPTALVDALADHARTIAATQPTDYAARRQHAPQLMSDDALKQLRDHLGAPHLQDLMLRERIWTDWALGHPALASRTTDTTLERSRTANQRKRWTSRHARALDDWCQTMHRAKNTEP